ncbi:DNA-binding protein [Eubacterium sp. 1001713B170207_170306_E7]|uniref:DNA-binding protein n=1 Tax=Eubacterium sp. 1001713B170207_170306_E7 TaxID=2787097 RepID=UPI001896A9B2|nr:DNA-binding protein [Eubacterium sp. 1001713B170207_170306_E7]
MIKYYLCVDDTDDLTKKTSTGKIAEQIKKEAEALGSTIDYGITRHQLLLDDAIAYTSHNSSMCFSGAVEEKQISALWDRAVRIIQTEKAETADPGLCLCRLDQLKAPEKLLAFGKKAQSRVIAKNEAYDLARSIGGTRLEEFGGTGIGVIGALAGVGLRLSGNDGSLRGKSGIGTLQTTLSTAEMQSRLGVSHILERSGAVLTPDTPIYLEDYAKIVLLDHRLVAVAKRDDQGRFELCKKSDLYTGDKKNGSWELGCAFFKRDNDEEECLDEQDKTCCNCLYRRWTKEGYRCSLEKR